MISALPCQAPTHDGRTAGEERDEGGGGAESEEGGEERDGNEPCDRTVSTTALWSSTHLTLQALTPRRPTERSRSCVSHETHRPTNSSEGRRCTRRPSALQHRDLGSTEICWTPRERLDWVAISGPMDQSDERQHSRPSARVPIHASTNRPVRWQQRTDGPNGRGRPPFVRPRFSANIIGDCSGALMKRSEKRPYKQRAITLPTATHVARSGNPLIR